jgi:uncharacterized protein
MFIVRTIYIIILILIPSLAYGQESDLLKKNYKKKEVYIPMRDGAKLFTAIYSPCDSSVKYPILFVKTPYGLKPYGENNYPQRIGPSTYLEQEKYIFVHQDARGMFKSTGEMDQMTPYLSVKPDSTYVDNSSDTYDAVQWLLNNTNNNGCVGLWGISYRGFYASSGSINAHPAIKCSSPQAPIADWYIGDDMHHNGAFALLSAFNFLEVVGQQMDSPFTEWPQPFEFPVRDAYNFFLDLGKLSDVNKNYFKNMVPFWDSIVAHPDYDTYWQLRNILPHLTDIRPAVLVTAGLFDQENLYGSMQTYEAIQNNSETDTRLVLGPWVHGGWARTNGDLLGPIHFSSPTSDYYQREIEMPFFNYYLKRKGQLNDSNKVSVFVTGINSWLHYSQWPPAKSSDFVLFLEKDFSLDTLLPCTSGFVYDEYTSDPLHPVPYTQVFHPARLFYNKEYMIEDQRFVSSRPDQLSFRTSEMTDTLIIQGPVSAEVFVSSSSSDYDLIIKIIDVYPDTIKSDNYNEPSIEMAGYEQLVRAEIFRAKYRNSFQHPEAILPGQIEKIRIRLNDISHAFLPGHRIMIQLQSSWFPLFDRNPQQFMNDYQAENEDYKVARICIYRSSNYPSKILFKKIP